MLEEVISQVSIQRRCAQIRQIARIRKAIPMCPSGLHTWHDCEGKEVTSDPCWMQCGGEFFWIEPVYFDGLEKQNA